LARMSGDVGMDWVGTRSKGRMFARAVGRWVGIVLGALLFALAAPALASATTLSVTTSTDNVQGSLRDVIASAQDGDTVVIEPGVEPMLTAGPIAINGNPVNNLTIDGQGPRATTITGDGTSSLFQLNINGTVSIAGVTMTQGGGGGGTVGGGAVYVAPGGSLSITDSVLTSNTALCSSSCTGRGGAISFSGSTLTLDRVTMTANSTNGDGGAVYQNGGVATITNSTIVNNTAASGGGIFLDSAAQATLIGDTLAHGNASSGGNILSNTAELQATVTLQDTIVALGNASSGPNCSGSVYMSMGGNLEDTSSPSQCGLSAPSDLVGVDPLLSSLAGHGGPTDTMALGSGSPAIDFIPAAGCPTSIDQRGLPRPDSSESACDIGAYETQDSTPVALSCVPSSVPAGQPTTCTASVANPAGALAGPPTGTVAFTSDGPGGLTPAAQCPLTGSGSGSSCSLTYTPAAVGSGSQHLTAAYSGDGTYASGTALTSVTVVPRQVSVAVGCAPAPIAVGQTTTCTATVTDDLGAGAGSPSGLVTFASSAGARFGSTSSCVVAGSGASASCALPYTPSVVGTDTITATYAGDSARVAAGGSIDLTVSPLPKSGATVAVSCSPGTVTAGQTTTCTATVTPDAGATAVPTGAVTFTISGAGGVTGGGGCTLVSARCSVSYTLGPSASGTYTVNAAYGGGGIYATGSGLTNIAAAPIPGVTANITVLSGIVEIKLPSSSKFVAPRSRVGLTAASSYVPIKGATVSVPVGSTIDAHRKSQLRLATGADYRSGNHPAHTVQTGIFTAADNAVAIFSIEQMTIRQALLRIHGKRKRLGPAATALRLRTPPGAVSRARCRRHGPPGKGVVREISGVAKGVWRTVGARSITTVRDTHWVVEDRCDGTLTEVGRGTATVTSTADGRGGQHPIVVNAGQGVLIKGRFL
jgi:hypothetical protein